MGIVIIGVISLFVSFCGIKVLSWYAAAFHVQDLRFNFCGRYERIMWIPVFVAYIVALGVGGKHLSNNVPAAAPATARQVLSFASTLAGFVITYSPIASDYTIYYTPDVPRYASTPHTSRLVN